MQPLLSVRRSASRLLGGVPERGTPPSLVRLGLTFAALGLIDAIALSFAHTLARDGALVAASALLVFTVFVNAVFLSDRLYPLRWLTPGLLLMLLLVVYPALYTFYIAFTNYSDGHLLTKDQVIAQFEQQYYTPPDSPTFAWRAYRSPDGRYLLWLTDPQGHRFIGSPEEGLIPVQPNDPRFGPLDPDGLPHNIGDYVKLDRIQVVQYLSELQHLRIGASQDTVRIASLDAAPLARRKYSYDPANDVLIDHETGAVYRPVQGTFTAPDGTTLSPGFATVIGAQNFIRAFTDPDIRGPFLSVFAWTFTFAGLSVLLTFSVGLGLALVLNDQRLPLKGVFRALAIIPYTIPGFISILVWVGLMNPYYGPVNLMIQQLTGVSPQWFSDPTLAKVAILLVNTWLGYPYMLLVSLGALQSIPADLYEAAEIDGGSRAQQFRYITLPLLLVAVGPLLIGSFAFNFNNFTVIDLVTEGGPPRPGTSTPAGHTDILISYTYRLAFAGGRGSDYGFAAAISVFIFLIVMTITTLNFRFTHALEEVSENV